MDESQAIRALLSQRHVAEITGLTRRQVAEVIDAGHIATIKVGRRRLIPRGSFNQFAGKLDLFGVSESLEAIRGMAAPAERPKSRKPGRRRMNNSTLEGLLGMIVFGPMTATLEGKAFTIDRLREAARFLEYSFAEQRRLGPQHGAIVTVATADNGQQGQDQPLAPAKPKRQRGRPAKTANGQAPHEPAPTDEKPLFQTADSALTP